MPVIRISDSNYKRLQTHAVPLKDTPNDVLSRILDLAEDKAQLRFPDMPEVKTADLLGLPPSPVQKEKQEIAAILGVPVSEVMTLDIQDGKLVELVEADNAVQS